jgi:hypothetical protein
VKITKKPPKKSTKKKKATTKPAVPAWTPPPTLEEQQRALQVAYNRLLSAHSLLHSSIESRVLLPPEVQASRLPMIREQHDEVARRLAEASALIEASTDDLAWNLAHDPSLAELYRAIQSVKRSSAYMTARELLGEMKA